MIPFESLPAPARALFGFWALMLCLLNIANGVLSAARKKYILTLPAVLLFAPVYFMWQVIFDISLFAGTEDLAAVSRFAGGLDMRVWTASLALFALLSAVLIGANVRYGKTAVTPGTVKLFLDKIPCGVCCFRDNGKVLFTNVRMNNLCAAVTGSALLNGNSFREAVAGEIKTVSDRVYRFSTRDIELDGETLHEITATDITDEYARTLTLEKDRAELAELNRELNEYYSSIDEAVRHREILQAKMNIHDEMNRLMLETAAADVEDEKETDRIFSLWDRNALLLCMEANDDPEMKEISEIGNLAAALKVNVVWQDPVPQAFSEEQRHLFFAAAGEAVINAVKHAGADEISVSFEDAGSHFVCRFENGGSVPETAVRFTGGLANISGLAERQGASVSYEAGKTFTLVVKIPKKY